MGRTPARLRSLLTFGLSDLITESHARLAAMDERLAKVEHDIETLRGLVRARDDRAQRKMKAGFSSLLNMIAILPELGIDGVLPSFPPQGFEITGEEAAFLFQLIRRHRPERIMELGSGSSTVLFAAALRANGNGRVISVEHDAAHARNTAQFLEQAGLSDWVEPVLAPLVERQVGARIFSWYDLDPLLGRLAGTIDLLFVDGPPGKVQVLSRYPALPVLAPHLSPQALVFVDDGGREDEIEMLRLWGELDDIAFESETLGFLPHAPVLLTMKASDARVAAFPVRDGRSEQADAEDDVDAFVGERRSSAS